MVWWRGDEGDLSSRGGAFGPEVFGLEGAGLEDGRMPLFEIVFDAVRPGKGTRVRAKPFHVVVFDIVFKLAKFSVL